MRSGAYRSYLLALLLALLASNYTDRFALGMLVQGIKNDFNLSDTQMGLLSGIAFAFFYALMGIPIARWADRGNRVTIISLTAALWGAAVALCGAAASFAQLLVLRVVVGIGEAGGQPPALSLISDHFDRTVRPKAVARYMLGNPLASVIAFAAGGWLNEHYGWRTTFVVLGIPSVLLAVLARLTLKDPRVDAMPARQNAPHMPLRDVVTTLWANTAFRNLLFCFSVTGFFAYGIYQWRPAFFMRTYGLGSAEVGLWLAAISMTVSFLGTYLGGELASRYAGGNEHRQLVGLAVLYAVLAVVDACVYLAPTYHLAFAAVALANFGGAAGNGPIFSATQTLVPPHMRATAMAILLLFSNLIGMGLGPLGAGMLSDALRPVFGQDSLRYALLLLCPGYLWAAWHLWRASQGAAEAVASEGNVNTLPVNAPQVRGNYSQLANRKE